MFKYLEKINRLFIAVVGIIHFLIEDGNSETGMPTTKAPHA